MAFAYSNLLSDSDNSKLGDWRTIKTDTPDGLRQLDLYIAYRLGYRAVVEPRLSHANGAYANVYDPNGKRVGDVFWNDHNAFDPYCIPHYTTIFADTLLLIPPATECHYILRNQYSRDGANDWEATLNDGEGGRVQASSSTPELATCDAWCVREGSARWDAENGSA